MTRKLSFVIAAAIAASPFLPSQSRNVTLLSRFDPGGAFNDVWGYVAPDGREYALLGSTTGTYVVETTNPRSPVNRGFISASRSGWRTSGWRDIRTYRNYAYIVTEGGGGMQIVDLKDPNNPRFVKTWNGVTGWVNTHNIAIDTQNGIAYPCGSRLGMPILDIKTDPENPRLLTTWRTSYVHDLQIQDGYAHLGLIGSQRYSILDVTQLPTTRLLGSTNVPSCHNAWPTRDNQYAVATTESSGGGLTVVDIRNRNAPTNIATFFTGGLFTSVHNAYMRDRQCHMSYYSEGLQILDLSVPSKPVRVGFYDTNAATDGFAGAWGCYPFQPSGNIYISDRTNGLFVLRPISVASFYGKATTGTGSVAPEIHAFGAAYVGNANFKHELENAKPTSPALMVLSGSSANQSFGGLNINIGLTGAVVLTGATDANGKLVVPLPVPNNNSLNGAVLYSQFFVVDGNGSQGFAATRGMRFSIFQQ